MVNFDDLNASLDLTNKSGIWGDTSVPFDSSGWVINSGGGTQTVDYLRAQTPTPGTSAAGLAAAGSPAGSWAVPGALILGAVVVVLLLRKG